LDQSVAVAKLHNLISKTMLEQNQILHESEEGFGGSGWKHADNIMAFSHELRARNMLDYGCGECTLGKVLRKMGMHFNLTEYDPAVRKRSRLPKPHDLVVCTDVLEHVEPDKLRNVLAHIHELTLKGCYLVIATRAANKILPNGANAHLIIEDTPFWKERVMQFNWKLTREDDRRKGNGDGHEVRFWLTR
jgi:2-polyprenyl-3-methyl-5-hydroxy-6-metoxy-1,4-benzoquinol methylase